LNADEAEARNEDIDNDVGIVRCIVTIHRKHSKNAIELYSPIFVEYD